MAILLSIIVNITKNEITTSRSMRLNPMRLNPVNARNIIQSTASKHSWEESWQFDVLISFALIFTRFHGPKDGTTYSPPCMSISKKHPK